MWSKKAGRYTKCRMHGGASTGPRTPEGLERCRRSNWKHGKRSAQWIAERRQAREEMWLLRWENDQLVQDLKTCIRARKRRQNPEPCITAVPGGFAIREVPESVSALGPELLEIAFDPSAPLSREVRKLEDYGLALRVRRHLEALDTGKHKGAQENNDLRVASLMKAETGLLTRLAKLAGLI
jgi:hypothetical protein